MATLRFNFSPASEPALALRIANLITQDIERLEKQVFDTRTNWQRLEKPFKAHYALELVNRMGALDRDAILKALPSYEKNAANYRKDSKRRGRPLTEYIHDPNYGNDTMPRIDASTKTQDDPIEQTDDALDATLQSLLNDKDDPNAQDMVQRMKEAVRQSQEAQRQEKGQKQQPNPEAEPSAEGQGEGESEQEQPQQDEQSDPLREAMQRVMEAMNVQQGEQQAGQSSMDEDRVREIAREEDGHVLTAVDKIVRDAVKQAAGIRTVELKLTKADGEVETKDLGVQHKQFPALLKLCGIKNDDGYQWPVWLPGPAGSGKTTAARNVAKALGMPFHFTGAVDNQYGLTGFRDAGGHYHRTSFREAFEHGGVFLWDEIDASNANAMTVFNAALENGVHSFPDGIVERHKDCIIIAAANTYGHGATHEYVGRNKLDAATVDRYLMLDWEYDEQLERVIAGDTPWTTFVQKARKACAGAGIKHVISPRASIRGNKLLGEGFTQDEVVSMTVRKGLPQDSWKTIKARMQ